MIRAVAAACAAFAGAVVCGGCAAGPAVPPAAPRAARSPAVAATATALAAPLPDLVADAAAPFAAFTDGAGDEALDEATLREQLATAADPTAAALALVVLLADEERHDEALAVLATAMQRHAAVPLRLARAELWRDLGQRHLAVRELVALRTEQGAAALAPAVMFGLAELQWLEGDGVAAAATLRELTSNDPAVTWLRAHAAEVAALDVEIASGGVVRRLRTRDALANLRGAPLAEQRLAMLDHLCRGGASGNVPAPVVDRALLIALGDVAAAVRARALERLPAAGPASAELALAALADVDPLVRRVAASRAATWLPPAALTVALRDALAVETDPTTFVQMHRALADQFGIDDPIDRDSAATPTARAAVVARWRARTRS